VRFWASARAAAGVPEVSVEVPGEVALDALVDLVLDRLPRRDGLRRVLDVCSVLVGDRPAGAAERASVRVSPGSTVEFLPPFAGG
jgi:molybdopterin converting factor small subunit